MTCLIAGLISKYGTNRVGISWRRQQWGAPTSPQKFNTKTPNICFSMFEHLFRSVMFGIGFDLKTCMVYVVCSGHLMFNAAKADHVIIRVWKLRGCNHSSQSSTGLSQNTFCGSGWILAVKYYMHIHAHITYLCTHRLSQNLLHIYFKYCTICIWNTTP